MQRISNLPLICYTKNLCLAPHNVRCLPFFPRWRFSPGILETDVDGGVDNGALRHFRAREEHEFCLVEDSLGLDFRFVGHV